MNAIPLINNAPRPNINVGSIGSPTFNPVAAGAKLGGSIGGNVMRQNPASMPVNNETQLRQEVNTSIVALKREAFSLENLIAQAAQTLQDINKRLSELEGKQGDYVKKADATVASVGGDGKYISAISETDGKINATATDLGNMVPVNSVTSGNMHSVTSGAVADKLNSYDEIEWTDDTTKFKFYAIKRNGIVTLTSVPRYDNYSVTSYGSPVYVGTLPNGYKPINTIKGVGEYGDSDLCATQVETNGTIKYGTWATKVIKASIYMSLSFPCA